MINWWWVICALGLSLLSGLILIFFYKIQMTAGVFLIWGLFEIFSIVCLINGVEYYLFLRGFFIVVCAILPCIVYVYWSLTKFRCALDLD